MWCRKHKFPAAYQRLSLFVAFKNLIAAAKARKDSSLILFSSEPHSPQPHTYTRALFLVALNYSLAYRDDVSTHAQNSKSNFGAVDATAARTLRSYKYHRFLVTVLYRFTCRISIHYN